MELRGKVVLITGASSGIGRELARALARRGAKLALAARRADRLSELALELGADALAVPADVTDRESLAAAVAATVARFGRLDVLVNNAGVAYFGTLAAMPASEMERVFRTNILGLLNGMQLAAPELKRTQGLVVNISSSLSKRSLPFLAFYAGTKSMVDALSDGMRMELRKYGVRVLNYCPPETETEFGGATVSEPGLLRGEAPRKLASAADVAERVARAMESGKREVVDGGGFLKWMNFLAPKFLDNLFYKMMVLRMLRD